MIYISYPSELPEDLKEVFRELAETYEVTLPEDREEFPKEKYTEKLKEILNDSILFIAEVSYPGADVEIEANWAHENKKPIILFVKFGRDYPKSLKDVHFKLIKYSTPEDLRIKINKFLNEEYPEESKKEYYQYSDKKKYQGYKKGWKRKYG
ncbi:MAG: hypothetical protein QXY45_01320 [Candidatus Aenigmatarchaeota archaeon]